MNKPAIVMEKLGKTYDGKTYAVHDLTIEIPQGAVFGFLGPNGAGKTTTVKLLTGLLKSTEGSCSVGGLSSRKNTSQLHSLCGVMTKTAKMYGQLTGMENLMFFGAAYGLGPEECKSRAEELLKRLDLWDVRNQKLRLYSIGMAQRLSLARCLVNRPGILLLDEPDSGLDPESAQTINSTIAQLAAKEGVTVFLCTNQLRYAEDICQTYGILKQGCLLACGTQEELRHKSGLPVKAVFRLKEGESVRELERRPDGLWSTEILQDEDMPGIIRTVVSGGHDLYEAWIQKPALEDVYFSLLEAEEKK